MITQEDIMKLKRVFATKEDLKRFATKEEVSTAIKECTDAIVKEVGTVIEMMGDFINRTERLEVEARGTRVILGDFESRLQKLEQSQ